MIKAVLPVRINSTRCRNKNFRDFAGSSLFKIKLEQLLRINWVDGVIVLSDSEEALEYALQRGCEIKEEPEVDAENKNSNRLFGLVANSTNADTILLAHATSPLLLDKSINGALDFFIRHNNIYDSVNSAQLCRKFFFFENRPLNYDPLHHPRSQDLVPVVARIPAFSIIKRTVMLERSANTGFNPYFYSISDIEAIDVDDELDFEIAEFLYKKHYC